MTSVYTWSYTKISGNGGHFGPVHWFDECGQSNFSTLKEVKDNIVKFYKEFVTDDIKYFLIIRYDNVQGLTSKMGGFAYTGTEEGILTKTAVGFL
tara:strand:- start:1115 stop:1399 length:285 start_codon:yes stop_codon:yes gene_type:complete